MYVLYPTSTKTPRLVAGLCAGLLAASAASGRAADQQNADGPRIMVSAAPANLLREENRRHPADSEFAQVYAAQLEELPILVEVAVALAGRGGQATLVKDGATWAEQIHFAVTKDGRACDECVFELVPGSDLIVLPLDAAQGPFAVGETLQGGEVLQSLWTLRFGDRATPPPGLYEVLVTPRGGASGHFDAVAEFRCDMRFEVLPAGDPNRMLENRIEGLFLTALATRAFDAGGAALRLDKAKELVTKYLAEGAGDENGAFNITPRYQAGRISEALGLKLEALGFYSQVVQGVAKESKMRHGHFGRERGLLPQVYADHLAATTLKALRAELEAQRAPSR